MGRQYEFNSFEVDASAFKPAVTAEELRLGNWLQSYTLFSFDNGEPVKKGCITPFKVDLKTLQMIYEQPLLVTMEPIPLTPEILEKAGFIKIQEGSMAQPEIYQKEWVKRIVKNRFDIHMRGGDENYWIDGDTIVELQYLHQLQNLYFALTGTELETNL